MFEAFLFYLEDLMAKKIRIIPELDENKLRKQLQDIDNRREKIHIDLDSTNINDANKHMKQFNNTASKSNTIFGKLRNNISNTFSASKIALTSYLMILREINKAGQNAKQTIQEIDKAITDLSIATNMSREATAGLVKDYNEYARLLSSTTGQVTSAADDYLRAGKTMSETQELIRDSIMLSKLGQLDSAEATKDLLATMNGYEMSIIEVENALDAMVAIDMEAATSSGDIATALKYCASSADVAGLSFNKLAAMIGAVQDKTQQSSQTIGTFMNTLLSRYRDVKIGRFVDDDGEDLSDVESVLNSLNISLRDSKEEFRDFETVIDEVAQSWNNYSSVQQAALAKALSGTRQQNRFIALMEGYNKTLELTEVAANSAGTAVEKFNNSYMNSLEAKQNTLQNAFEAMVIDSDFEKVYAGILDSTTALVDFINQTNALKGVMSALAVSGGIKAFLALKSGISEAYIVLNKFYNAMDIVSKTTISTKEFERLLLLSDGLSSSQMKLILSTRGLSVEQKKQLLVASGLSEQEAILQLQTWKMTAANTGLTVATTSAENAFKALWMTIRANPLMWIATLVGIGVSVWQKYKQSIEEAVSAAKEAANAWSEASDSLEEQIEKVRELREELSKGNLTEEEAYQVKSYLFDIQQQLSESYGDQADGIDLVNGKLETQIGLIKELNKSQANEFLNEEMRGIEEAEKQMNKSIGNVLNGQLYLGQFYDNDSDTGNTLKDIISQYSDFITTQTDMDGITTYVYFKGNATEAKEVLNDFMTDVRNAENEISDENILNGFQDNVSAGLKTANEILDEYEDLYKRAQQARLVADENLYGSDDTQKTALEWINDYADAVKNYNDALLSGDNTKISEVAAEFDKVDASIQDLVTNTGMSQYADQIDEIRNQLNDTAIAVQNFRNALDGTDTSDFANTLKFYADELKGLNLEDIDIHIALDTDGEQKGEDAIQGLASAADEAGLSVEQLIDLLVELGYIQGQINSDLPDNLTNSFTEALSAVQALSKGFGQLDAIYADVYDKEDFDWSSILNNDDFVEVFASMDDATEDYKNAYSDFIETVSNSPSNINACQQAFDNLASAYLYSSGILKDVTESTKDATIAMLEQMGVENAKELVDGQLAAQQMYLALTTSTLNIK